MHAGIKDANFKNSLAYLKGWIVPLKNDPKMLIYAAQKAHQAANYFLGIEAEGEEYPPSFLNQSSFLAVKKVYSLINNDLHLFGFISFTFSWHYM